MKRRYEIIYAIILISFLIIANFVNNTIIKGILLLLFSGILIVNTAMKLRAREYNRFVDKLFYGILLFLEILLAIGSVFVIVLAVMGV